MHLMSGKDTFLSGTREHVLVWHMLRCKAGLSILQRINDRTTLFKNRSAIKLENKANKIIRKIYSLGNLITLVIDSWVKGEIIIEIRQIHHLTFHIKLMGYNS